MITPIIFGVLCAIDFVLILYTFLDSNNRVYGNVVSGVISIILSFMLSYYIIGGNIIDNGTTVITDSAIGFFFIFIGILMILITIFNIFEILYVNTESEGENETED